MLRKLISMIKTINFSFQVLCAILISDKRTRKVTRINDIIRRFKMDIIITMAYTALMTFIAVKVVEHTPSENNRK